MVGAGSVVTHSVPDYALVLGSPARWRAWVCRCGEKLFPTSGRLLGCACGRSYEQIAENEVKEFAANGSHESLPGSRVATDFSRSIIKIPDTLLPMAGKAGLSCGVLRRPALRALSELPL